MKHKPLKNPSGSSSSPPPKWPSPQLPSLPVRPGTAPPENKAKKHTNTLARPRLLRDYNQALGFMVIGLSHFSLCSGSQQQVMAHSCLTAVTVKKKGLWNTAQTNIPEDPNCSVHRDSINTSKRTDEQRGQENRKHFRKQEARTRGRSSRFSR